MRSLKELRELEYAQFEVARIHFLSTVSVAVALVIAYASYFTHRLGLFRVGQRPKRFTSLVGVLVRESSRLIPLPPSHYLRA